MSSNALDKRLRVLETNSTRRIETLADFVLWMAHGKPEPVEFAAWFEEAFERAKPHQEARDAKSRI